MNRSDNQWKNLWFDLRTIAKGHFEEEEICRGYYWSFGSVATIGVITSGGTALLDGVLRAGSGPLGEKWLSFIRESRALARAFPYFSFASLVAFGFVYFCDWKARGQEHHKTAVRYNDLARRAEDALHQEGLRTAENWEALATERSQAEAENMYSVSNHVHNYAKGVLLHRKVEGAPMPSLHLKHLPFKWFHASLEKSNNEKKRVLMATDLADWQ